MRAPQQTLCDCGPELVEFAKMVADIGFVTKQYKVG